jgi:hypothetical protein
MKLRQGALLSLAVFLIVSTAAFAKTIVVDEDSFGEAAMEACQGKSVGIECSVEFQGGSIGFGVCVEINGPAGGYLTCQIDTKNFDCKNNSLGTPGTWLTFGSLAGILLFIRRRKKV